MAARLPSPRSIRRRTVASALRASSSSTRSSSNQGSSALLPPAHRRMPGPRPPRAGPSRHGALWKCSPLSTEVRSSHSPLPQTRLNGGQVRLFLRNLGRKLPGLRLHARVARRKERFAECGHAGVLGEQVVVLANAAHCATARAMGEDPERRLEGALKDANTSNSQETWHGAASRRWCD